MPWAYPVSACTGVLNYMQMPWVSSALSSSPKFNKAKIGHTRISHCSQVSLSESSVMFNYICRLVQTSENVVKEILATQYESSQCCSNGFVAVSKQGGGAVFSNTFVEGSTSCPVVPIFHLVDLHYRAFLQATRNCMVTTSIVVVLHV